MAFCTFLSGVLFMFVVMISRLAFHRLETEFNWFYVGFLLKFLRMDYHLAFLALGCLFPSSCF